MGRKQKNVFRLVVEHMIAEGTIFPVMIVAAGGLAAATVICAAAFAEWLTGHP